MSIQMYFINETKKQVVSSKKLYGRFEDDSQLLAYLNLCQGDTIKLEFEHSVFVEDFINGVGYQNYRKINLYEYNITQDSDGDLYDCSDFDRLMREVQKKPHKLM